MIANIIKFQLKERLTNWISLVFFLMLVFQGIWYTKGTFDYYVNDGVLMNAPAIFYKNFAGLGMLMVIMIVILTGGFLYKDIQHKTANWIYTLPVSEKKFFVGRYLSAFLINLILGTGYFLGMLLVPYSGIGEPHRFGAAPIGQMLHGVLIFLIPNLLLFNSVIICTLVYSRRMTIAYLTAFMVVVFFLVMQTTAESSGYSPFTLLADPNGYVTISECLNGLSTYEKNNGYVPLSGYLLANRLIWLGISSILFVLAYMKFKFKDFVGTSQKRRKSINEIESKIPRTWSSKVPIPRLNFRLSAQIKKTFTLAALEFYNIVRPSSFRVIIGILVLMITLQNLMWNASYYIGPEVPLTSSMTYFRLPWGVIITMLLMIWSGELFFKDKTTNIWQIMDALPIPQYVTQLSRLLAISAVAFVLCLVFIGVGIVSQTLLGGFDQIDLPLYFSDVLGYKWGWLTFVLQLCFVFFIAGLTGSRYTTHILSVGVFLITIISFDMNLFEQVRYGYALTPAIDEYSEMSGYGIWVVSGFWFFLMWASLAVVFILLGVHFWDRGQRRKWYRKLSFTGNQLNIYGKIAVVLFLSAFFGLRQYIEGQAYSNGNFEASAQKDCKASDYERRYQWLEEIAQPKYREVNLSLDYYPEERKAIYKASLVLVNPSKTPVNKLYLNFKDFVKVISLQSEAGSFKKVFNDEVHHLITYQLPAPLDSGSVLKLELEAEKQYVGFTQSGKTPQADLMYNGSFGSVREFLPVIGYDDDRALNENRTRMDEGLSKLSSRMLPVDDSIAITQDAYAKDALWTTGKITLSTTHNQTCVAPGKLIKHWEEDQRNYFVFEISKPAPFNWQIGSAEYAVQTEGQTDEITYQILSDKKHHFNGLMYRDVIRKGLTFIQNKLGEYPYDEIRLMEINRYHDPRYALPNLIAISEKEGWVADTSDLKEKAYLYLTVISELSKHWLNHKVHIANVQGADMLKVALPEAIALHIIEERLGKEAADLLVKKKMDIYGKDHYNEPNLEPPLLYADGADYLEINKGAVALYQLINEVGADAFFTALSDWIKEKPDTSRVFKGLYIRLKTMLPAEKQHRLTAKFEEITA